MLLEGQTKSYNGTIIFVEFKYVTYTNEGPELKEIFLRIIMEANTDKLFNSSLYTNSNVNNFENFRTSGFHF